MDKQIKVTPDPQSLTTFGEPKEESSSGATGFFKYVLDLFSSKKDERISFKDTETSTENSVNRPTVLDLSSGAKSKRKSLDRQREPGSEVELRFRSLSSFLKDIPKLVKRPQSPGPVDIQPAPSSPALSVEELRQYWMPDEQCHECYECSEKFTTFRRRHHCRICGQIFCSRCCNQLISGKIMGLQGMLRSCMYCCQFVLRFAEGHKPDMTKVVSQSLSNNTLDSHDELINDSNSFESLSNGVYDQLFNSRSIRQRSRDGKMQRMDSSFSDDQLFDAGPTSALSLLSPVTEQLGAPSQRFIFDSTQPDSTQQSILGSNVQDNLVKDSLQLHLIWRKVCDEKEGIEFRDHRLRLRKYSSCITGQELVDWLMKNDLASDRTQGCAIGQALCEGKWMKPVVDDGGIFQDGYVLFQNHKKVSKTHDRIEIYPDHFAVSDDHDGPSLRNLAEREPVWVQEIKCSGENDDDVDGDFENASDSELTWSDAQSTLTNDMLLYSDEEQSVSGRSVISLSSFVEIDQGEEIIKYKRSSAFENSDLSKQQKAMAVINPSYDDSSLRDINADYLRAFITWNGTYLNHPWHPPSLGWREADLQSKSCESCDKRAFQWMREMYLRHNLAFLRQLLSDKDLDVAWAEVLLPLARHASSHIGPNPNVSMDICHYVQVKKLRDGFRRDSQVVNGVVFTKNVVNKHMKTDILNPSILLLAIPLEYERVQMKLSALDPVIRQEREFYKHLITRITSKHPDIVLVQCTVSRIAQELLLEAGITVVINVKSSVMERLARCTEADVVYSIDQLLKANLGKCSRFYLKRHVFQCHDLNITSKTLLYFDGCKPMYGCTVILRSKSPENSLWHDLAKVQYVFRFLLRAMFHVRLELSYLIDQHNFGKLLRKYGSVKAALSESEATSKFLMESPGSSISLTHVAGNNSVSSSSCSNTKELSNMQNFAISMHHCIHSRDKNNASNSGIQLHKEIFENSFNSVLLSTSPLIKPSMPYLYSDRGISSASWKFLPPKIMLVQSQDETNLLLQSTIKGASAATTPDTCQDNSWLSNSQKRDIPSTTQILSNEEQHATKRLNEIKHANSDPTDHITKAKNETQLTSCYSRQYERGKMADSCTIIDALSSPKRRSMSQGNYTWEKTMIDMIFGSNKISDKKTLYPASQALSHNKNIVQPNLKSSKKGYDTYLNANRGNILHELGEDSLHEFITFSFTKSASSDEVHDLLASFRAHAGSLFHRVECEEKESIIDENEPSHNSGMQEPSFVADLLTKSCVSGIDPYNHQHISVLFSSYSIQSPNAPHYCVLPWVVNIDFYRGNDITLGGFLERYCFRPSYHCPNVTCRRPMVEHVRNFVHGNMCMSVLLKELSKPFQQSSILSWSWDHVTKKSSAIKTMSHDAWFMSFAKYLEINFGQLSIPDMSSLAYQQRGIVKQEILDEHWELKPFNGFQYFLFRDLIAAFKCFPVHLYEIVFPSALLSTPNSNDIGVSLNKKTGDCYDDIFTADDAFNASNDLAYTIDNASEEIQDCIHSSQNRKVIVDINSEEIPLSREKFFLEHLSSLNDEKSLLLERVDDIRRLLKSNGFTHSENLGTFVDAFETQDNDVFEEPVLSDELKRKINLSILHLKCDISKMVLTWNQKLNDAYDKDKNAFWNPQRSKLSTSPRSHRKRVHDTIQEVNNPGGEMEGIEINFTGSSSYPRHSSSLGEKCNLEASDMGFLEDETDAIFARKLKRGISADSKPHEKHTKGLTRTRSSMKSLVTRLLPGNILSPSSPMPFPADEHYLLPECLLSKIIVRDAEPTSIIAYALCSCEYKKAMKSEEISPEMHSTLKSPAYKDTDTQKKDFAESQDQNPKVSHKNGASYEASVPQDTESGPESISTSVSNDHIEVQFEDTSTRFYCKVYFARLFERFRSKIMDGGQEQYHASMSRSVKWLARGGKSGSTFHKTRDDQFILKQMSHFEMQSFLEFAPKYISYVTECVDKNKATAISKILGVYRISFRNSETGRSLKQDVLVIENLFYKRHVDRIFDLKGSVRNRHVKPVAKDNGGTETSSKKEDIILLDENLLKMMCENPLYVHEHTKYLLKSAIQRDTDFLSQNLIMDYSLLIGIDDKLQIYIGIIDFIRTFTWDKKLEMVVKWSSSRSMPTVVSPELYKNRFCEAMDQYFQVVPDRWYGMHLFENAAMQET